MKRFIGTLIVTLMTMSSQASTTINVIPNHIVTQQQIVTQSAPARVKHKRIVKRKVQRAVPFGMDDSEDVAQADDIATGYRRRDLNKIEHDDDISEHVRWRLFLARQLALIKFRQTIT